MPRAVLKVVRESSFLPPREVKSTLADVVDTLTHDPAWVGVLGMNELDQRIVFRAPPPFGSEGSVGPAACRPTSIERLGFETAEGECS